MPRPRSTADGAKATAFRLPPELLARVDAYAGRLRAEAPWSGATRAHALRALLTYALDSLRVQTGATKAKPRR